MTADSDTALSPPSPAAPRWANLAVVGTVLHPRILALQGGVLANRSPAVAALARLRRGVGKPPGEIADILEHTLSPEFAVGATGDEPTPAEIAAHITMTLYATHQQSQGRGMHQRGYGLGRSLRLLHPGPLEEPSAGPLLRRFNALGTANSLDELVHHARGAIQLLRASQIPLDYAVLADQLVRWQRPDGASAVRLVWGRDFYRTAGNTDDITESA